MIFVYSDGGARGNPGPSGSGIVIKDTQGKILQKKAVYLGHATNNQAEYYGLLLGVQTAKEMDSQITFRLDSQLVVKQMLGEYKIKDATLRSMAEKIQKHCLGLDVHFEHIPRAENADADAMANLAMDRGTTPGETFTLNPTGDADNDL